MCGGLPTGFEGSPEKPLGLVLTQPLAVVGVGDALDSVADVVGVVVGEDVPDDEVDAGELVAVDVRVANVMLVVLQAERSDVGDVVRESSLPHEVEEGLVVPQDLAAGLAVHRLPELEFFLCVGLLYFLVLVFVVNSKFGGVYS